MRKLALAAAGMLALALAAADRPVPEEAAGNDPDPALVFGVGEEAPNPAGLSRIFVFTREDLDDRTLAVALYRLRDGTYGKLDPIQIVVARTLEGSHPAALRETGFRASLLSARARGIHELTHSWFLFTNRGRRYVTKDTAMTYGTLVGHRLRDIEGRKAPLEEVLLRLPTGTEAWIVRARVEELATLSGDPEPILPEAPAGAPAEPPAVPPEEPGP